MPLPKPKSNEDKDRFLARCMGDDVMVEEYPDNKQRFAVCNSLWQKEKKENIMEMEKRYTGNIELRVKDDNDSPEIVGYSAVFNKLSEDLGGFKERITPGAFNNTLKNGADVRALVNHNSDMVIGRNKAKTLKLIEDDRGLFSIIDPPNTTIGNDIIESVKRGDVDGMSFAFKTITDEWNKVDGVDIRTLLEVELFDISIVTYPAYPDTTVAVRSREKWLCTAHESVKKAQPVNTVAKARLKLIEIQ